MKYGWRRTLKYGWTKTRSTFLAAIVVSLALSALSAQQPQANTEIYLAELDVSAQPMIKGPLTNISNNPGYDSQPSFLPDGSGSSPSSDPPMLKPT